MIDLDKIREEIKDLSYKDKLELLKEKGNDIEELIEELQGYVSEISSLADEIRTEQNDGICKDILQSLKGAGYNMELDSNGNLSFTLGLANFTIIMQFLYAKVQFYKVNSKSVNLSVLFCLSLKLMAITTVCKYQKKSVNVSYAWLIN